MDQLCRIELFGGLRAQQGDRVITRFRTQKTGALLAHLALAHSADTRRQRAHSREALVELFWSDYEPEAGRNYLSKAISSLRHQLEPPGVPLGTVIEADRFSVRLNPTAVTTDVAEFESALQATVQATSRAERIQLLVDATELYQDELLPGYYEEWILPEQQRLAELFFPAVAELLGLLEQDHDVRRALEYARRAVSVDRLREDAQRDLIRLLAACGQPGAALRQYRELERLLKEELGSAPSAATRVLAQKIQLAAGTSPPLASQVP